MKRAAQKARELAEKTGSGPVIIKDGLIIEERPE